MAAGAAKRGSPYGAREWVVEAVLYVQVGEAAPGQRILNGRHVVVHWNVEWLLRDRLLGLLLRLFGGGVVGRHDQRVHRHVDRDDVGVDVLVAVPAETVILRDRAKGGFEEPYMVRSTPVPAPATTPVGP